MSVRLGLLQLPAAALPEARRLISRSGVGAHIAVSGAEAVAHVETRACWGFCRRCNVTHALPRSQDADAAAGQLLQTIRTTGRLDFDADVPVRFVRYRRVSPAGSTLTMHTG